MRILRCFLAVLLIIIAFSLLFSRLKASYHDIPALFGEAHKSPLWFLLFLEVVYYLVYGFLAKTLLEIAGAKVKLREAIQGGIIGVLGFQVAPFVGAAILLYSFYKKLKIPRNAILFLVSVLAIFNALNYIIFSFLSAVILPQSFSSLFPERMLLTFLFALFFILGSGLFLLKDKAKNLISLLCLFAKPVNKVSRFLVNRKIIGPEKTGRIIKELLENLDLLFQHRDKTVKALVASLFFYSINISLLYCSFYVFGFKPNIPLLVLGFTASSIISLLSFFPEAPGVMEASLVTVFLALGFPAHVSLFASLLYRLVSYWLPLPIGLFVYLGLNGARDKLKAVFFEEV
jgi:hypothetical protein